MTRPDGEASPAAQQAAIELAMEKTSDLAGAGHELVITHGNEPQVGNLLVKNEIAASVVPPVPLDWCGAQTQATIGLLIMNALGAVLARRGLSRRVATLVTRTLVDADDPGFGHPVKPIGPLSPRDRGNPNDCRRAALGEPQQTGVAASGRQPAATPRAKSPYRGALLAQGYVVVAAGGGGIPVVWRDGKLVGAEAVLDKDLTAALLGQAIGAEVLVIATDVAHAAIGFGTPPERQLDGWCPPNCGITHGRDTSPAAAWDRRWRPRFAS